MMEHAFPRPLDPFERYMVLDDRPGYRMTFLIHVDFDGRFDHDLLARAIVMALDRHPMLCTTVERGHTWRTPMPAEHVPPVRWIPWADDPPADAFAPLDISREPGVRFFAQETGHHTRWLVQAHHAVADGPSMGQFCWEVGIAYAALAEGHGTPPAWLPAERESHSEPADAEASPASLASDDSSGSDIPLSEILGFLTRRPARIRGGNVPAGTRRAARADQLAPPTLHHTFDEADFQRIRKTASAHGATVNDLFLAALLQTLADWNARTKPPSAGEWLRVMVPATLRTRHHSALGAVNAVGYAFLDRQVRDCADTEALIAGVRDEIRNVRINRVGARIVSGMALADRVPGLLGLILHTPLTLASVVFTNLGRMGTRLPGREARGPDVLGPRVPHIVRIRGSTPLRPGTRAGFVLLRLRNTLTLSLRTDAQYLDREASEALLSAYVARVHTLIHSGDSA